MDNGGNRLYLNFGNNNERLAPTDRTYPTTPSTFPQPVFSGVPGQSQGPVSAQSLQQNQHYSAGYAPSAGYFQQSQYPSQYAAAQLGAHTTDYASAHPNAGYGQARSATPGANNDPNTGLANQFSHHNLGGAGRSAPYAPRGQPSGPPRPRTAGGPGQPQPGYNSYLNAPLPLSLIHI